MDGAVAGLVLLAVLVIFAIIVVAKSVALARAFDQPWHIGNYETLVRDAGDAQIRDDGREWVVGDLRTGRAELAEEGAFARIW